MTTLELSDNLAEMFKDSRIASGKSQDYIAKALGVSRKTIQNWEAGFGSPSFRTAIEWFEAIGVPMYPYLMALLYPDQIHGINANSDIKELKKALHLYVDELDDLHVRELLYLLYGSHGSSPTGSLDLLTAYLHLPLAMRVPVAENVLNIFEMAEDIGFIKNDNHVLPQKETIKKYIDTAREAVKSGKETYTLIEKE